MRNLIKKYSIGGIFNSDITKDKELMAGILKARTSPEYSKAIMANLRALFDGGATLDKDLVRQVIINPLNPKILEKIMRSGIAEFSMPTTNPGEEAQRTFLLDDDLQEQEFLKNGWIKGEEGDYGVVNKAVQEHIKKGRNIPVYQRQADAITRDRLTPIGNLDNLMLFSNMNGLMMGDMGSFRTALYVGDDGKIYQKVWDLNDYGGSYGAATAALLAFGLNPGEMLDSIGNPVVVTSGYLLVDDDNFYDTIQENKIINKVKDYNDLLANKWWWHLQPEITITNKPKEMLEGPLSKFIRFKRGGLLPRKFQFGGQTDYYELPTTTVFDPMIFDPRVYAGRKGGSSSNEANLKAMWTKAKPFYDELTRRGVNPYIAVGILGNMALESSFDPNASYKGHYGYLLNETSARDWINASYGGYGHQHQMNFLIDGLTGKLKGDPKHRWAKEFNKRFSGFLNATRNSKDINYITHAWEQYYERSGGLANSKRLMYARYFAKQLGLIK